MRSPNIKVTVDAVVFREKENQKQLLLIRRKNDPFKDHWALPGGFVEENEELIEAVKRELKEETGIRYISCRQLYAFGTPDRDPRGRVITIAYTGMADPKNNLKASDDAKEAKWFPVSDLPEMAFDHLEIIKKALSEKCF